MTIQATLWQDPSTGALLITTTTLTTFLIYSDYRPTINLHTSSLARKLVNMGPDIFKVTLNYLGVFDLLNLLLSSNDQYISNNVEERLNRHQITVKKMDTTTKVELSLDLIKEHVQTLLNYEPLLIKISRSNIFLRNTSDSFSDTIKAFSPTAYYTPKKGTGKRKSLSTGVPLELGKLGQSMTQFKTMGITYMFIPGDPGSMATMDNKTSCSTTSPDHVSLYPICSNCLTDTQCQFQSKVDLQIGNQQLFTSQAISTQMTGTQEHTQNTEEHCEEDSHLSGTIVDF